MADRSLPRAASRAATLLAGVSLLAACGSPAGTGSGLPSAAASAASSPPATRSASATPSPSPQPTAVVTGWRQLAAEVAGLAAREDHTWTLDPVGGIAYLFGGRAADGAAFGDLWAFDLGTGAWEALSPSGPAPEARFGHNAAWVDGIGLVIFGGQAGTAFFADLWAYDPQAASWRQLPASGAVPVARYGSCAALGPDGRLWISHGFTAESRRFADTRAYDFATGAWTDETPSGDVPVARCLHGCWWTDDGRLALFAGQTTGATALDDLWLLTVGPRQGTHTWVEAVVPAELAARNLYAAAGWGPATLVFGGQALDGSRLSDTWLLSDDGSAEAVTVSGGSPAARSGAEMIADPARGRILLFGGRDGERAMNDLWELALPVP